MSFIVKKSIRLKRFRVWINPWIFVQVPMQGHNHGPGREGKAHEVHGSGRAVWDTHGSDRPIAHNFVYTGLK